MLHIFLFLILFHNIYYVQGINYNNSVYFIVTNQSFTSLLYRNSSPILSFQGIGYLYEYNNSLFVIDDNGNSLDVFISYNGISFHEEKLVNEGFIEGVPLFSLGFVAIINNGYLQVYNIYNDKIVINQSYFGEPFAFYYPYLISGYIGGNGIEAYEYNLASNTSIYLGMLEGINFSPNGSLIEINDSKIVIGKEIIPLQAFSGGDNYIQEDYYNGSLYVLVSSIFQNKSEIELIRIDNEYQVKYLSTLQGAYIPTSIIFEDGKPYGIFIDTTNNNAYEISLYSQKATGNQIPVSLYIIIFIIVVIGIVILIKKIRS
ncbi:hypothetical protein [Sulfurisphaera ohwakuensis]|uniref:Uncharacterized protein n=1 Tax=Sulfurisphaera ohwakuensis TaxID=69656 RepID=A0A650CK37_SULOH|nr:hypothetical protein [Sulfurisphaera ohwakuensis]MBB5254270.1 hypothetical protein [Sulfurisphaera ohwakuensis]QGR18169.1 hypothetical protein D1869_13960 [Sulfurisphaera ohwakuensis]